MDLTLIQGTFSFKGLGLTPADNGCDLQRNIEWFCFVVDIDALLFRQYLCDASTESQFYCRKMTAWSSAFDCGVARPLVYSKSLSLIENVLGVDFEKSPPTSATLWSISLTWK